MPNNVIYLRARYEKHEVYEQRNGPRMLMWAFVLSLFSIAGLIELYYRLNP